MLESGPNFELSVNDKSLNLNDPSPCRLLFTGLCVVSAGCLVFFQQISSYKSFPTVWTRVGFPLAVGEKMLLQVVLVLKSPLALGALVRRAGRIVSCPDMSVQARVPLESSRAQVTRVLPFVAVRLEMLPQLLLVLEHPRADLAYDGEAV